MLGSLIRYHCSSWQHSPGSRLWILSWGKLGTFIRKPTQHCITTAVCCFHIICHRQGWIIYFPVWGDNKLFLKGTFLNVLTGQSGEFSSPDSCIKTRCFYRDLRTSSVMSVVTETGSYFKPKYVFFWPKPSVFAGAGAWTWAGSRAEGQPLLWSVWVLVWKVESWSCPPCWIVCPYLVIAWISLQILYYK